MIQDVEKFKIEKERLTNQLEAAYCRISALEQELTEHLKAKIALKVELLLQTKKVQAAEEELKNPVKPLPTEKKDEERVLEET